ncbi:MAG: dihydrolipoyl dehydrogenase [bacterium]
MNLQAYDVVVIGGGPGGYAAALRAAALGSSVALIEKREVGGTCLNRGCIPTKALLESARLVRAAKRGPEFGVTFGSVTADPFAIAARSRSVVEALRKGVEDLLARGKVTVIRGEAMLRSAREVEARTADGSVGIAARSVIVATGSRWSDLPGLGIDGERVITSDEALSLEGSGGAMVMIGGGAVGCEMAEIYSALGTQVTVVEMMEHLLPSEDSEIAKRLEAALKRKGIAVATSSRVVAVEREGDGLRVSLDGGRTLDAARVLVGVGRRPNVEGLGLERAGVAFDRKGISVDDGLRTSAEGVYAVGDVTGKFLLAHVATAQGLAAAENACGGRSVMDYSAVPRCVYTDPEFAAVGLTEAQARAGGAAAEVYRLRLGRVGRAVTMGETFGLVKVISTGASGRVLGFHALAPHASELVAEMAVAIRHGLTPRDIADVIHPHPTLSELIWEAASGAAGRQLHGD